ncbi:MAG TPA: NAD(P)-dependent alcohol dehydrogenase [Phycisphaerae bacterium]|nr:NAD(P)-dependent alcohol dehydrogenase [Phycisphaerae bacterium]
MKAIVLEKDHDLRIRDIDIPGDETLGADDVRIDIHTVGVCGSDVHFYLHGSLGPFEVKEPLILGHEASGTVSEVGSAVTNLAVGDRVCMEPGIPDPNSKATRLGMYNLDPAVKFWATPPYHGCLRPSLVHPAVFTFKLPDNVSFGEGALVEPLAVGMHAAGKARIKPGDIALVLGAGTIGLMTAISALAGGCSRVIITDVLQPKLDLAASLGAVTAVNLNTTDVADVVNDLTDGWGADIVFEATGKDAVAASVFDHLCPGGCVVFIGCPGGSVPLEIVKAQTKEARMETIFRYAHVYPRCLAMMGAGKIDLKPFISKSFPFDDGVDAFDYHVEGREETVKVQIVVAD